MARFVEAFRCAGVDELAHPPTMVVPLWWIGHGAENQVVLEDGEGLRVHTDNKHITIEEIRDPSLFVSALLKRKAKLAEPGVDPQQKKVLMPDIHPQARYFRIGGKTIVNPPGALVYAGSGPNKATLRVVVLAPKNVRLSIRNVTVPDESGTVVFHAMKPCDPEKESDGMVDVWQPQTNIMFNLVSSKPIFLDDRETPMREKLAKALGLAPNVKEASFYPERVDPSKVNNIFKELNDRDGDKADFTIFVVDKVYDGKRKMGVNGSTNADLGIAFIGGSHFPTTFAHEAGHFLARGLRGKFMFGSDGHTGEDVKLLMRRDGSSWKIPYDQAIVFRENLGKIIG